MRRRVALLSLLVLSWSHAAALRCDIGAMTMTDVHEATTMAHHDASQPSGERPATPQGRGGSGDAESLPMLACGVTAVQASQGVSARRAPTISVRPARLADVYLDGPREGIDLPRPRHDV